MLQILYERGNRADNMSESIVPVGGLRKGPESKLLILECIFRLLRIQIPIIK